MILRSSLREVDAATTLARVATLARELGITRVTDVTRLDRYGVPVCIGIRPDAQHGSLCVTAGKGLTRDDAAIGATMEAIEMAWAEYGRAKLHVVSATARTLADPLVAFAPRWGQRLDLDMPLPCVVAHEMFTGEAALVPAELVFHPFHWQGGGWFGTGTNGLASGNSVAEATLHALLEVIERDALAFYVNGGPSQRVTGVPLPLPAGLDMFVRQLPSVAGVAVMSVLAADPLDRAFAMRGDGCHLVADIALVRAFTEAMQSRLACIHGGRDDLVAIWRRDEPRQGIDASATHERPLGEANPSTGERAGHDSAAAFAAGEAIAFADVPTSTPATIADALADLRARLAAAGMQRILRVVLTPPDYPVQVVRVIVPGLECFSGQRPRVGPRLRAARARSRSA